MYEFALYRSVGDNFPTEIGVDGALYPINADFRVILRIFRVQERTDVSQTARNLKTLELFYADGYPKDNPFAYFSAFVSRQKTPEVSTEPPVMDYFFDADVIYTSFRAQYGIDLLKVPFMHWYEFLMLLEGLGENTPLHTRINIRTAETEGLKGKKLVELRRAKKRVALPRRLTEAEIKAEQAAIMARFGVKVDG